MNANTFKPIWMIVSVIGAIMAALLWRHLTTTSHSESHDAQQERQLAMPFIQQNDADLSKAHEQAAHYSIAMSTTEFNLLRVALPRPVDAPWNGPFYNSHNCFDEDKKEAAVEVLPTWIRRAVLAGENELAGRYLFSIIKLTQDKNMVVATRATLALYQMGDSNGVALAKMKEWLQSGIAGFRYLDTSEDRSELVDIRTVILRTMDFYKDASLIDTVYDAWMKGRDSESSSVASVDLAYYLEKHGKNLPRDYWQDRLNSPYGFENALEIAEVKKLDGLTDKLGIMFADLKDKPASSMDAGRAAEIASSLFRLTGGNQYRDYLIGKARAQLESGDTKSSFPKILESLAKTNDGSALETLSIAVGGNNEIIREQAIDALGHSTAAQATDILSQAARKTAQGNRFPSRELRSLLVQATPNADLAYQLLQKALNSGTFGWSAVASDFEHLEVQRRQKRQ